MTFNPNELHPWRRSGMLTFTRTHGEVAFQHNGTQISIWLRINGQPRWFSIRRDKLQEWLKEADEDWELYHGLGIVLFAESDGNAEEDEAD